MKESPGVVFSFLSIHLQPWSVLMLSFLETAPLIILCSFVQLFLHPNIKKVDFLSFITFMISEF